MAKEHPISIAQKVL